MNFFKESKSKKFIYFFFFFWGGGGGGWGGGLVEGLKEVIFFTKNRNLKKTFFVRGGRGSR